MIIGVMGKSGSGKTYFSNLLNKNHNFTVIHVDEVVHKILNQLDFKEAFIKKYNTQFLSKNLEIDRKKLGDYLFASKERMNAYNDFIYPWVEKEIDEIIKTSQKPIIIDWMQLPITKYFEKCDKKILLCASSDIRLKRVKNRDQISDDYYKKREDFMLEYDREKFDDVVVNDDHLEDYADSILSSLHLSKIGFYAGSFDPFTNGHLEIIKKASLFLDKIVIGIGNNPDKKRTFSAEKMKEAISYSLKKEKICADVIIYLGQTAIMAKEMHCNVLIRGLRNQIDYMYEEKIAQYNEEVGIDTLYLRAGKLGNISSTLIRRKLQLNEDVSNIVPESVYEYIKK